MGFAVVDVNMRGTGCSGGAFDFFEALQNLDGYDVIQTIAHQSWVLDHKVGMMGISYGGISQLFTAQLDPPALEAIAPLSVIDATATTLYPGGILQHGFAVAWSKQRQYEARPRARMAASRTPTNRSRAAITTAKQSGPARRGGQPAGQDPPNSHYRPSVADSLDPVTFVHKIKVPTFMACQSRMSRPAGTAPI